MMCDVRCHFHKNIQNKNTCLVTKIGKLKENNSTYNFDYWKKDLVCMFEFITDFNFFIFLNWCKSGRIFILLQAELLEFI